VRARLVLGVALALATPARAQTSFTRFLGGGHAATDCMLVADVAGATGRRAARCADGDPQCDADGVADGTCRFQVRLCLDAVDASRPRCRADVVTGAAASDAGLAAALRTLPFPVSAPETCTAVVEVPVARRGRRGRLVLEGSAGMASGHTDRDRVALVCRRPAPPATFATLQRKVFTPRCATLSCHGGARAGGLGLPAGSAYADLVGVPPDNMGALAAGLLRVAAGDPGRSFLLRKVEGTLAPGEGDRMPQVGTPLGASSIALIRRWIIAGAPADAPF